MYNSNMLTAHFVTSHSQYLSQPAFDNTQVYASCNCYQYENMPDIIFRVVQNNSQINFGKTIAYIIIFICMFVKTMGIF